MVLRQQLERPGAIAEQVSRVLECAKRQPEWRAWPALSTTFRRGMEDMREERSVGCVVRSV